MSGFRIGKGPYREEIQPEPEPRPGLLARFIDRFPATFVALLVVGGVGLLVAVVRITVLYLGPTYGFIVSLVLFIFGYAIIFDISHK